MRWLLLCALVGCVDSATGSDQQPVCANSPQLAFERDHGNYVHALAVAEGGKAQLSLQCILDDLPGEATWDLPSIATSSSDAVSVDDMGSTLFVHGDHAGTATVELTASNGAPYGSIEVTVAAADHLAFNAWTQTTPENVGIAFAKELGTLEQVVLASSTGIVLIDDNMIVTLPAGAVPSSIRPGELDIAAMPVSDGTIVVESGGTMHSAPLSVVDHADAITLEDPRAAIPAGNSTVEICFAATNASRFVTGLRWSFTLEEGLTVPGSNCESAVSSEDVDHDGVVTLGATAGGVSAQIGIPIH